MTLCVCIKVIVWGKSCVLIGCQCVECVECAECEGCEECVECAECEECVECVVISGCHHGLCGF